jgi:hypothetical protein
MPAKRAKQRLLMIRSLVDPGGNTWRPSVTLRITSSGNKRKTSSGQGETKTSRESLDSAFIT